MPKKPEIKVLSGDDEFTVSLNGRTLAAGWGPGVDGCWYARVLNNEPVKVADRNEAFAHAMQAIEMVMQAIEMVARGEIQ